MDSEEGISARRGRKPSQALRDAMVAAAIRTFAREGLDAATTRAIAAEAGTTERTLFKHFGSKAGLVAATIEAISIDFARVGAFARVHRPDPFTRAAFAEWHRAFLLDRVAHASAAPDNYRVLFAELLRNPQLREDYGTKWRAMVFDPLARRLAEMQERGEITRNSPPPALAGAFFSLNLSYLLTRFALAPGLPWRDEADVEAIVALFSATCAGEPVPSA